MTIYFQGCLADCFREFPHFNFCRICCLWYFGHACKGKYNYLSLQPVIIKWFAVRVNAIMFQTSKNNGVAVEDVVTGGEGLTFQVSMIESWVGYFLSVLPSSGIWQSTLSSWSSEAVQVYPEAITQMPIAPLFSFLFFIMLCLLAMSSIVGKWLW